MEEKENNSNSSPKNKVIIFNRDMDLEYVINETFNKFKNSKCVPARILNISFLKYYHEYVRIKQKTRRIIIIKYMNNGKYIIERENVKYFTVNNQGNINTLIIDDGKKNIKNFSKKNFKDEEGNETVERITMDTDPIGSILENKVKAKPKKSAVSTHTNGEFLDQAANEDENANRFGSFFK
jgi:hypothetical protein